MQIMSVVEPAFFIHNIDLTFKSEASSSRVKYSNPL